MKLARRAASVSMRKLAELTGYDQATLSRLEAGKAIWQSEQLAVCCAVLRIDVAEVLAIAEPMLPTMTVPVDAGAA